MILKLLVYDRHEPDSIGSMFLYVNAVTIKNCIVDTQANGTTIVARLEKRWHKSLLPLYKSLLYIVETFFMEKLSAAHFLFHIFFNFFLIPL